MIGFAASVRQPTVVSGYGKRCKQLSLTGALCHSGCSVIYLGGISLQPFLEGGRVFSYVVGQTGQFSLFCCAKGVSKVTAQHRCISTMFCYRLHSFHLTGWAFSDMRKEFFHTKFPLYS